MKRHCCKKSAHEGNEDISPVAYWRDRAQSLGEEIANSISHGVALLAALAVSPVLIVAAVRRGSAAEIAGASIFVASMVAVYLASTLYHAWPKTQVKRVLRVFDHGAVYLLIAGTYTPFTLGVLYGVWGWVLFGLVWTLALSGIALKIVGRDRFSKLSMSLYLIMGGLIFVAAKPVYLQVPRWGIFWLLAGGVAYLGGLIFYSIDEKIRYGHFIWHLFVISGTACHVIAVFWYAA